MRHLGLLALAAGAALCAYVSRQVAERALRELGDVDWARAAEWSR